MKKLILSLTIAAFAVAVQAGENKAACKDGAKGGCCSEKTEKTAMKTSTVKTSTEVKSGGCCSETKAACSEKASKGKVTESKVLMSPKVAAEVASR